MRVHSSKPDSTPLKLVLEDGEVFDGLSFGGQVSDRPVVGEAVFNTGMVGYTEALTDPSYAGQLLCFTFPLVGNYGVPDYVEDSNGILLNFESDRIRVRGVIVSELAENPSHFLSRGSLNNWLFREAIPGIHGVDTRDLTIRLRQKGVMMAALGRSVPEAKTALDTAEDYSSINFYDDVSTKGVASYGKNVRGRIALIDCGVKLNIVRSIVSRGFEVFTFPYNAKYEELMTIKPVGAVISNGPGDPRTCEPAILTSRELIDNSIPTLGICLGTQIIALSLGVDTYKLKYGHRGQNKPCLDLKTGRCLVTSQNHGYSVSKDSLQSTELETWFLNADDNSIEGLLHKSKPCISVQFHPEASPGPFDASYVFDIFSDKIRHSG